jgi:glycosyltransferase involved in cell wall biosynthesis
MARTPLVSCILRRRSETGANARAAGYLLRQDYGPCELIVVDDNDSTAGFASHDRRVRYIHLNKRLTASEFRNYACGEARGEIILECAENWWYAPHHVSLLAGPLAHNGAEIAIPERVLFFDVEGRAWEAGYGAGSRGRFAAGCVAYRRSWWERHPFHSEPAGEDTVSFDRGRIVSVDGPLSAIGFSSPPVDAARTAFPISGLRAILGRDLPTYWPGESAPAPAWPIERPEREAPLPPRPPLVSCITLAHDSANAAIAIDLFQSQDYERRELILVDCAGNMKDLLPSGGGFRYLHADREEPIGGARNRACAEAAGDLIAHWEEHDWHSGHRLRTMVAALLAAGADLCGAASCVICDVEAREAALVQLPAQAGFEIFGESLLYRRAIWQAHSFPETDVREDLAFVRNSRASKRIAIPGAAALRVRFGQILPGPYTHPFPLAEVRRIAGEAWSLFDREQPLRGRAKAPAAQAPAKVEWRLAPVPAAVSKDEIARDLRPAPSAKTAQPAPQQAVLAPGDEPRSFLEPAQPLVSCIMPTRGRPAFVRRAVEYFLRQDYGSRELLIVDDGSEPVDSLLPPDPRIRYIRPGQRLTIGAKRNLACEQARGEIVLHWDDDDWQSPGRIGAQVETLEREGAELCGLGSILALDWRTMRAWRYRCPIAESSFYAVGTSLCYRRGLWERVRFADVDVAEDRQFIWNAAPARMAAIHDSPLIVAILHGGNTARLRPGGDYWQPAGVEEVKAALEADWGWYAAEAAGNREAIAVAAPAAAVPRTPIVAAPRPLRVESNGPLVSCIMPTHNRRRFVPLAIQLFLRQDYEPKQLVVLDDGTDSVEDLIPHDDRFLYIRLAGKMSLGAKRNLGCSMARGDIIMHWDDDDWQGSQRIRHMTGSLLRENADLCGLNPLYFYDIRSGLAWLYRHPPDLRFWVAGTSFCYRRQLWERNRFSDISVGEDNHFLWGSTGARMIALPDTGMQVALLHDGNGSPKVVGDEYWQAHPAADIQWLMGPDFFFYRFEPPLPRLNLGCADAHIAGMCNVDRTAPADQIADLRFSWPWSDSSVEFIRAHDIIEHLPDRIHTMNEIWRVLRPGARIEIAVPTTLGTGAFQDPTHVSYWNRRSFLYFEAGNPYRERFAQAYGITAAFCVISEEACESVDGERLTIVLEAVK